MNEEIRVHVVKYPTRKNLVMRYVDPLTNKQVTRSTGTAKKREAERVAAKWEAELQEGRYQKRSRMTWDEFVELHENHVLSSMEPNTIVAYESSLNVFKRLANPKQLSDVTTARMTAFTTKLREQGRSSATVARHLRHLKVIYRWASEEGYLPNPPKVKIPKQPKGMRGRAITTEEFERMLDAVPNGLFSKPKKPPTTEEQQEIDQQRQPVIDSWRFYINGLWASGLRLEESLTLSWDEAYGVIVVDFSGRRPLLRIPAEAEKGKTHRLLPITPEFAELLATVPEGERRGRVFKLLTNHGQLVRQSRHAVGPRVAAIGRAAGVVTDRRKRKGEIVKEFASAHDLRRSFGFRWSRRVMPTILRELMRHAEISTTMQYYVGVNAEATADELWQAAEQQAGSTLGSTLGKSHSR